MSAADFLADLQARGVRLRAEGDRLKVVAPKGAVTPEDREALARLKADLLAALQGWNQAAACELLVSAQVRLKALLDGPAMPEPDLVCQAAYRGLAAAHDARDWPAFLAALDAFEKAWRRLCC